MKKLLILIPALITCFLAAAQAEDPYADKAYRFQGQIGFDATGFLKQFVVLNNSTTPTANPFSFNGKFLTGFKSFPSLLVGPRAGFGYATTHTYSNNETQSNERSDDTKARSSRIGIEVQQLISKRWIVYYGLDYINTNSTNTTVTTSTIFNPNPPFGTMNVRTEITDKNKAYGFGPVLGVQFNINKWMCLGTETSFYTVQSKGGTKVNSSNPNNSTPETFTDSKSTQFTLPFFVNFNIVF